MNALKITPTLTIAYASINLAHKPLDDVRIREALNLAVERETLVERILKLGDLPAYRQARQSGHSPLARVHAGRPGDLDPRSRMPDR